MDPNVVSILQRKKISWAPIKYISLGQKLISGYAEIWAHVLSPLTLFQFKIASQEVGMRSLILFLVVWLWTAIRLISLFSTSKKKNASKLSSLGPHRKLKPCTSLPTWNSHCGTHSLTTKTQTVTHKRVNSITCLQWQSNDHNQGGFNKEILLLVKSNTDTHRGSPLKQCHLEQQGKQGFH